MALRFNLLNRTISYKLAFVDIEASSDRKKILDFGALQDSGKELHTSSKSDFTNFISGAEYLCGHNIIHHDLIVLKDIALSRKNKIDTLYLSPLLFPKRPYHKLLKDDKIQSEELNNPLNDCKKTQDLFWDEFSAFNNLPLFSNLFMSICFILLKNFKIFSNILK